MNHELNYAFSMIYSLIISILQGNPLKGNDEYMTEF